MPHANRTIILGPEATQAPLLEFDTANNRWRIWQAFNGSVTQGTYLDLYPNGLIERVTVGPHGVDHIDRITGPVI